MFRPAAKKGMTTICEINVTPLVDVSLVLVIIFMVTVPMLFSPVVEIIMPKAESGVEQNRQVIYVTMTKEAQLLLDSEEVNFQQLSEQLRDKLIQSKDKVVIIRGDERLAYDQITRIMAIAKKTGVRKLYFATEHKKKK